MKSLRIAKQFAGKSTISPQPLPFVHMSEPPDLDLLRAVVAGEASGQAASDAGGYMPTMLQPATECWTMRTMVEYIQDWHLPVRRQLVMVISGEIELFADDGSTVILHPGDVYYLGDMTGTQGCKMIRRHECRTVHLGVPDELPEGELPPAENSDIRPVLSRGNNFLRMYTGADNKAYFRDFDNVFPKGEDIVSQVKPCRGFNFVRCVPGLFVDWHPEFVNNFAIVLAGKLGLEVSGDHRIESFGLGDIVLAEDRTGEGHIDRMYGETCMAVVEFDNGLWD